MMANDDFSENLSFTLLGTDHLIFWGVRPVFFFSLGPSSFIFANRKLG